jgi:UDP-N-acetylglucosamine--N-acetylmuramyl-(pentapeptide) pyrophosphoryl-undecaprenol N-acetylglucosamine transferase
MGEWHLFFAGGGTGGHIYPAIAVAEQVGRLEPAAKMHFFCSERSIDREILSRSGFDYTPLPARYFSARPDRLTGFAVSMFRSFRIARRRIGGCVPAVLLGVGGFASAPAVHAAYRLGVPVALLNVDAVPGKANRVLARFARMIFVQFEGTRSYFVGTKAQVLVTGCPLRSGFNDADRRRGIRALGLDEYKKTLVVMGGSAGAQSINEVICSLIERLEEFSGDWQVVHLAGRANLDVVRRSYVGTGISSTVLGYWDQMADLLAAADLVVGRSGGVSVAEYAAAGVPSICVPYPYHKDRQQHLNAAALADAGGAVVVEQLREHCATAAVLWEKLRQLMADGQRRKLMADACRRVAVSDAAGRIAKELRGLCNSRR